jgi:hypothetical protein
MRGVRGAEKQPGEVRRSQNWISGTRPGNAVYVPPPPHVLPEVLSAFEQYLHAEDNTLPPLWGRARLSHAQGTNASASSSSVETVGGDGGYSVMLGSSCC